MTESKLIDGPATGLWESAPPARPARSGTFGRRVMPAFLGVLLLCYLVYGRVHIVFTRTESGWMLEASQRWASIDKTFWLLSTHSYHGHYVPLFFLLEMLVSKLCGINEAWWRVHQLVALTVLILALSSFFGRVAALLIRGKAGQFWLKIGLTAPLVFSPLMIEFVSWPFEVGQLLWAALTVCCLSLVSQAIIESVDAMVSTRKLGWSLVCGYGSMHVFGLGAATMAAWLAVWVILFVDGSLGKASSAYLKTLGWVGSLGLLLTTAHGALMLLLPSFRSDSPLADLKLGSYAAQTLGYSCCLLWESLRSLAGPDAWPYSRPQFVGKDWVYGLGLFLTMGSGAVVWFRAHRTRPTPLNLSRVCWHVFSLVAFGVYVGMVSLRIRHQGESWLGYLLGPRYLWPSALLFFGFFASGAACVRFENPWSLAACACLVSGACVSGNVVYQETVIPKVWPWLNLSHEQSWRRIGHMASDLQRAGLPLPDLPLGKLGFEWHLPLAGFESLVRLLAGIPKDEAVHWVAAPAITPVLWREMQSKSPALVQLSADVFAEQDASERLAAGGGSADRRDGTKVFSLVGEDVLKDATLDHVKDHPNLGVDVEVDGVVKKSVWIDVPTTLTYHRFTLGLHSVFRAAITMHPAIYHETNADGAVFQVDVLVDGQTRRLASVYLNPIAHPELRKWMPMEVDLTPYAGKTVDLILSNSPGPANNDYADWCIWGDPRLVDEP